jgi:hypothetical protein
MVLFGWLKEGLKEQGASRSLPAGFSEKWFVEIIQKGRMPD